MSSFVRAHTGKQSWRRRLALLCAGVTLAFTASLASAAEPETSTPSYEYDPSWPRPFPNNWLIGDVTGVSVDRHDHVWILHRPSTMSKFDTLAGNDPPTAKCCVAAPPVLEFDTDGTLLKAWGGPKTTPDWFDTEHSIFVDAEDNVWILGAGARDGQLLKFTADGKLLLKIGKKGEFGAADDTGMLGKPTDMVVDTKRREIYVSDGYRNKRVIVFDSDTGAFKRQWTAFGRKVDPAYSSTRGEQTAHKTELDLFTTVHCVTMTAGEIYVCDRTNNRIQVFKPDGTYVRALFFNRKLGGLGSTWDAAPDPLDPDRLLVLDGSNSEIGVVDRKTGAVIGSYMNKGRYGGQMHWPHQFASDKEGRLYIGEVDNGGRVQRFVPVAEAGQ
ncbi:MAG: hypothetical protein AB7U35_10820 [Sphingobium sp.]